MDGKSKEIVLRPSDIRYTQSSISNKFSDGTLIGSLLDDIIIGRCFVSAIKKMEVKFVDGLWYSADNRRLWVFKQLECLGHCPLITVKVVNWVNFEKCTSKNGGTEVSIRGGEPGGIWYSKVEEIRKEKPQDLKVTRKDKSAIKKIKYRKSKAVSSSVVQNSKCPVFQSEAIPVVRGANKVLPGKSTFDKKDKTKFYPGCEINESATDSSQLLKTTKTPTKCDVKQKQNSYQGRPGLAAGKKAGSSASAEDNPVIYETKERSTGPDIIVKKKKRTRRRARNKSVLKDETTNLKVAEHNSKLKKSNLFSNDNSEKLNEHKIPKTEAVESYKILVPILDSNSDSKKGQNKIEVDVPPSNSAESGPARVVNHEMHGNKGASTQMTIMMTDDPKERHSTAYQRHYLMTDDAKTELEITGYETDTLEEISSCAEGHERSVEACREELRRELRLLTGHFEYLRILYSLESRKAGTERKNKTKTKYPYGYAMDSVSRLSSQQVSRTAERCLPYEKIDDHDHAIGDQAQALNNRSYGRETDNYFAGNIYSRPSSRTFTSDVVGVSSACTSSFQSNLQLKQKVDSGKDNWYRSENKNSSTNANLLRRQSTAVEDEKEYTSFVLPTSTRRHEDRHLLATKGVRYHTEFESDKAAKQDNSNLYCTIL